MTGLIIYSLKWAFSVVIGHELIMYAYRWLKNDKTDYPDNVKISHKNKAIRK